MSVGGPGGNRTHLTILLAKQAATPSSPTAQFIPCAAAAHANAAAIRCGLSIETIRTDEDRSVEDNAWTNPDRLGLEDAGCHLVPSSTPRPKDTRDDAAQSSHRNQLSSAATDSACGELRALLGACHSPHFSHPSPQRTGSDRICS